MNHYFTNNRELKSEKKIIKYELNSYSFEFTSDNGVFSKSKIDYGSRLLVETYLKMRGNTNLKVLDVGCGYGFMGIVIGKVNNADVDLVDVNERAIELSQSNLLNNKIAGQAFISNVYDNVQDKYDLIITNPPIRAGKKTVLKILMEAKNYLLDGGEVWYVMRKKQGAESIKKVLLNDYEVEIMKKSNGFGIFRLKIVDKK